MSKSKIQLDHNVKKLKRQRKYEESLRNERIHNQQMYPSFGKTNIY